MLPLAPQPWGEPLARQPQPGSPPPGLAGRGADAGCPEQGRLPVQSSAFFGRDAELEQMAARLADPACRLLTVLGPGGMGKSRLAIQAASALGEHFADGVRFVDLAPLNAPDRDRGRHPACAGIAADRPRRRAHPARGTPARAPDVARARQLRASAGRRRICCPRCCRPRPRSSCWSPHASRLHLADEWLLPLEGLATPPADRSPAARRKT